MHTGLQSTLHSRRVREREGERERERVCPVDSVQLLQMVLLVTWVDGSVDAHTPYQHYQPVEETKLRFAFNYNIAIHLC